MHASTSGALAGPLLALWAFAAPAESGVALQPRDGELRDRFEMRAYSETYAELFRRALLPGPNGALVTHATVAPVHQYASLRVDNLDAPWRRDSLDLELAAWGRTWVGRRDSERRLDADIQVASATYRHGRLALRVGRQYVAGGAARFARFDGIEARARLGHGLDLQVYGGWTALPRWNQRPRYEHLGAATDASLQDTASLESTDRRDHWLSGGRLSWAAAEHRAGLSIHEQHEQGGLTKRNAGVDARTAPFAGATLGANAVFELGRRRLADARLWLDTSLTRTADVALELLHTEPALFLSNQSVLSVFGSAAFDEVGSYATWRAHPDINLHGAGFVQVYAGERPGARAELGTRFFADAAHTTFARLTYSRVATPDNGYHSLRAALSRRFALRLRGTLEAYAYLYDRPVRGYRSSSVFAGTVALDPIPPLSVLWGASLARTPYALVDLQSQLRVSYTFDLPPPRRRR
jgi:hypothetical protein